MKALIDKSGKSSLIQAFHKSTSFKHICVDRCYLSSLVYADLYKRSIDKNAYLKKLELIDHTQNCLLVLTESNNKDIIERCILSNEQDIDYSDISVLNAHKKLFKMYYTLYKGNKLLLNTSDNSISECIELIKRKIAK